MANVFDRMKRRARGEAAGEPASTVGLAPAAPPASEGAAPEAPAPEGLAPEAPAPEVPAEDGMHGVDARRVAEAKAEEAGRKWRAAAEARGEIAKETGGPKGLEPTRYGDWEKAGRCFDF